MASSAIPATMARNAEWLAKSDPDRLRAVLFSEPWIESFLTGFKTRLDAGKRDALRLFAESVGLVGAKGQLHVEIYQRFGADSEDEVHAAMKIHRMVTVAPEHERLESMAQRLEGAGYIVTRPSAPHVNGSNAEEVT